MNTTSDTGLNIFSVTVLTRINRSRVEDLLCAAFEGGIGYWAMVADEGPWPLAEWRHQLPARGSWVRLSDSTGEGWPEAPTSTLDGKALERGLQVMADKYPKHWSDFIAENEDSDTGNVFVQCCIFGEVVFG